MDIPIETTEQLRRYTAEFDEYWNGLSADARFELDRESVRAGWIVASAYREMQTANLLGVVQRENVMTLTERLLLEKFYEAERKQDNRNYAKDHSFEEWLAHMKRD